MSKQVQKTKSAPQERTNEAAHSEGGEQADLSYTDDLLDEIDGLLETNAEEFVKQYVQLGGE